MSTGGSLFFADSNLLLYTLDRGSRAKQRRAGLWIERLWSQGCGRLSWQVLHEFYWNATRKLAVPPSLARSMVGELANWVPVDSSFGLIERAWFWSDSANVPYWDGLIVAAAERVGAGFLLSEDFQPGLRFGECTVLDPFASDPDALLPAS